MQHISHTSSLHPHHAWQAQAPLIPSHLRGPPSATAPSRSGSSSCASGQAFAWRPRQPAAAGSSSSSSQDDSSLNRCPNGLKWSDIRKGPGPAPALRSTVRCTYEGRLASNGQVFDKSSWLNPISFTIGVGMVIQGWDLGILGSEANNIPPMQEGGRRRLVIPPQLAYGESGFGGGLIPPNATLDFEVELLGGGGLVEQAVVRVQELGRLMMELKNGV